MCAYSSLRQAEIERLLRRSETILHVAQSNKLYFKYFIGSAYHQQHSHKMPIIAVVFMAEPIREWLFLERMTGLTKCLPHTIFSTSTNPFNVIKLRL